MLQLRVALTLNICPAEPCREYPILYLSVYFVPCSYDVCAGCSWHHFGNVEQWHGTTDTCDSWGYSGCFCEASDGEADDEWTYMGSTTYGFVKSGVCEDYGMLRCATTNSSSRTPYFISQHLSIDDAAECAAAANSFGDTSGIDSSFTFYDRTEFKNPGRPTGACSSCALQLSLSIPVKVPASVRGCDLLYIPSAERFAPSHGGWDLHRNTNRRTADQDLALSAWNNIFIQKFPEFITRNQFMFSSASFCVQAARGTTSAMLSSGTIPPIPATVGDTAAASVRSRQMRSPARERLAVPMTGPRCGSWPVGGLAAI